MTGHKPGQAKPLPTDLASTGYGWAEYLDAVVSEVGSLAQVAERLWGLAPHVEDLASIERGLRRLRGRGQRDGGDHGRRLLHLFGLPRPVGERLKWMGLYHARFADLPVGISLEVLRAWNRPPVSQSDGRVWLELGFASAALRSHDYALATRHLERVSSHTPSGSRIEWLLLDAYLAAEQVPRDDHRARSNLEQVEPLLLSENVTPFDRDNWRARWLDQRAHLVTTSPHRSPETLRTARVMYETISDEAPAFALTKRETGLAFIAWKLDDSRTATEHAKAAVEHAGDAGLLRLRASALSLLARILGPTDGAAARRRAEIIARNLADDELLVRVTRR